MTSPALRLQGVSCTFAAREGTPAFTAVRDVTLDVAAGEFVSVVGPTAAARARC